MRKLRALIIVCLLVLPGLAWAEGTQFTGSCSTIAWNANLESDLAGYRIYDRVSLANPPTQIASVGSSVTSVSCSQFNFNEGQHYISVSSFDTSSNESNRATDVPFVILAANNVVLDLRVTVVNATSVTLAWTEVNGGLGDPATYDVRFDTPTLDWGTAPSVTSGTCTSPVAGTAIGATKTCTVTGLSATTAYQFRLVPYRGTPPSAIFLPLSNIVGATTGGSVPGTTRIALDSDTFGLADGGIGGAWQQGYTNAGGDFAIVSNEVRAGTASVAVIATFTRTATPNRQWASSTFTTINAGTDLYPTLLLRASAAPTLNAYEFGARAFSGGCWTIRRFDSNVQTPLASDCSASVMAAGETLLVEADGSTLNLYRVSSGGTETLVLTTSDAVHTTGRAGMLWWMSTTADVRSTPFTMGTFESAGAADVCGCDNH